jgi:hypothetical protein
MWKSCGSLDRRDGILPSNCRAGYVVSAEGAVLLPAWGNAPGCRKPKTPSAESAIHFRHGKSSARLRRAFSAGLLWNDATLGRCPRLPMNAAPLALNRNKNWKLYFPRAGGPPDESVRLADFREVQGFSKGRLPVSRDKSCGLLYRRSI